jgi:hypothetical protein
MNIDLRAPSRNFISRPIEFSNPIIEFSSAPRWPATAAGAHLHRRYHVPAGLADLIAALAGLGLDEVRR